MKEKIAVFTEDIYLYAKIAADVGNLAEVMLAKGDNNTETFDLCLIDIDTCHGTVHGARTMSRSKNADIKIPFAIGEISAMLLGEGAPIRTNKDLKTVTVYGSSIKLTELEYALFSYLYEKNGEFSSRQELLSSLWGENTDGGILNVYIHYLREKLEFGGEKIIISSRKHGYKIDERFIGGEVLA